MQEAFGQYGDTLKMRGVDAPTAIRTWVAAQSALDADPVSGLKMLIQSYGTDVQHALEAEFGQTPASDDQYSDDPEIQNLRRQLATAQNQVTSINTQAQSARQQEAIRAVQTFRETVDDKGAPQYPHFDAVSGHMKALLSSGEVPDLKTAYDQAVWSVPEYREQFAATQKADAEAEAAKRRQVAAARAHTTGTTVNGAGSTPPPPDTPATMSDDLRAAWNQ